MKFLLAFITLIMSVLAPFNAVNKAPDTKQDDFKPVIRFTVASDSHVGTAGDSGSMRVQKVFSLGYDIANKDSNYNRLDAAMFAGDLTDDGTKYQFVSFMSAVNSAINYDETKLLTVVAKSHDGYRRKNDTFTFFEGMSGENKDFHTVINGFHFIGISASKNADEHYTENQREWLTAQLDEAVKDDPSKPVFVMHHEHVFGTVYGSREEDGWGIDYFKDIFEKYPQIVHFSGHSHYPINDPRSIWQGEFTAIGTGALKYAEFTVDGESRIHPDGYKKMAQMWLVEVDADNTIRLRGFDALCGEKLCEYYIKNPADSSARQYTPAQQKDISAAPSFADGAKLIVKKFVGGYKVTVPAAEGSENNPVFLYRVYVFNKNGEEISSQWIMNNYWNADTYESVTASVKAEKGCIVKVAAENAYGKQSEILEYSI